MISQNSVEVAKIFPYYHPTYDRTKYARLIMTRENSGVDEVFVQRLDNGLVVYPGGLMDRHRSDPIEELVRELGEETHLSPSELRTMRNYDLLWGSLVFQVQWMFKSSRRSDICHLIHTPVENGYNLLPIKDTEINKAMHVPIRDLADGKVPFKGIVPINIKVAAEEAVRLLPTLRRDYASPRYNFI